MLSVSVLVWRHADGRTGCCAVRGGVLTVNGGREIAMTTREGQLGGDTGQLEHTVLASFLAAAEADRSERVEATQTHLQAVREIVRILRSGAAAGDRSAVSAPGQPSGNGPLRSVRLHAARRESEPGGARHPAQVGTLGWMVATPALVGLFLGRWIDRSFGTSI